MRALAYSVLGSLP
jgi:hypothetical protein